MTNGHHDAPESPSDIRALLAHLLAGVTGKSEAHWEKLIGEVAALPIVFNPRSNWRIDPNGTKKEIEAIEKAARLCAKRIPTSHHRKPDQSPKISAIGRLKRRAIRNALHNDGSCFPFRSR